MLQQVRRSARSGLSYIMVAGLIVIFAFFFGVPTEGCMSGQTVKRHLATVAGEDVYTDDVNIIYNRVFGSRSQTEEAQIQRQQAQALKAYLIIQLLAHKAQEAGLRVSDEEFVTFMQDPLRNPEYASVYGRDGVWDGEFYQRYVKHGLRINLPDYETFKRRELLARKYMNLVEMQIGLLPQELASQRAIRETEIELEFVKLQPDKLTGFVEVSDDEVAAFISENGDRIQTYYDANIDDYSESAQMQVRRIYLELGESDDEGRTAQERFELAKQRLADGEDFATVAGEINDALKDSQGFMPMTARENMNQDMVEALEDAEVGEVREVTTAGELMLVKLEERKDAVKTPVDDVREDIARQLLQQQKVEALVADLADELMKSARDADSLEAALAAHQQAPSGDDEGDDEPAQDEADQERADTPWSALSAARTGPFTLEGEDMSAMFGGQLPPGVSLGRAPWDRIPQIGQSRKLAVDAFTKLSEASPLAEQPYTVDDSKVLVRLVSKSVPEEDAEVDEAATDMLQELRAQRSQQILGGWQALFVRPAFDYGPWLEEQYADAVASGLIRLRSKGGAVVSMIDPAGPGPQAAEPQGGSPIELGPAREGSTGADD